MKRLIRFTKQDKLYSPVCETYILHFVDECITISIYNSDTSQFARIDIRKIRGNSFDSLTLIPKNQGPYLDDVYNATLSLYDERWFSFLHEWLSIEDQRKTGLIKYLTPVQIVAMKKLELERIEYVASKTNS